MKVFFNISKQVIKNSEVEDLIDFIDNYNFIDVDNVIEDTINLRGINNGNVQ